MRPAGGLSCRTQSRAFGKWSPWIDLGKQARSVAAQPSYTDGLEVFAIGLDDEISHTWCEELGAPWKDWSLLEYESSPLRGTVGALPTPSRQGSRTSRT